MDNSYSGSGKGRDAENPLVLEVNSLNPAVDNSSLILGILNGEPMTNIARGAGRWFPDGSRINLRAKKKLDPRK